MLESQFAEYTTLIPIAFIGAMMGLIRYVGLDEPSKSKKELIKTILTSLALATIVFSILTAIESLPYLAKVGISASVAFFGIDKAIEIIQKLISLRGEKK